jgi:hypothetical protein
MSTRGADFALLRDSLVKMLPISEVAATNVLDLVVESEDMSHRIKLALWDISRELNDSGTCPDLGALEDLVARWRKVKTRLRVWKFLKRLTREMIAAFDAALRTTILRVMLSETDDAAQDIEAERATGRAPPDERRSVATTMSPIKINGPPAFAVPRNHVEEAVAA